MRGMYRGAAFGLITALSLTACGSSDSSDSNPLTGSSKDSGGKFFVVGSANFPENQMLAEIYAEALEAKGLKVTRKFDIEAREVYYDQIVKGGIQVFPEYNGALLAVAVDKTSTATSTEDINAELKKKLPSSVTIPTPPRPRTRTRSRSPPRPPRPPRSTSSRPSPTSRRSRASGRSGPARSSRPAPRAGSV
ncbi:glycine betaine ABC transporter substrate-binding protein [Streptomyces canus]